MRRPAPILLVVAVAAMVAGGAFAYPLSGYENSGIRRLYAFGHREIFGGRTLPAGAQMPLEFVQLRLTAVGREFDVSDSTARDPELQAGLEAILGDTDPRYSIALLDITDPAKPRYAALNETKTYLPGSIGKVLVATGLLNALASAFPAPEERLRVLRETWITADDFVRGDHHSVPIVDLAAGTLENRVIRLGDRFTLFEWIDHALSPSSNAAGATSWKQAMLLRRFGSSYPPSAEQETTFFSQTSKTELTQRSLEVIEQPLREAGLDTTQLRQGTMFTPGGRAAVPGVRSYASPRELLRLLLRIEQGRLIDEPSSLELKRLLYFTKRRYRYAVSPALDRAALYFKSGSFYRCAPEPGFRCRQYAGNVENLMNSIAVVETPAVPEPGATQRVYLVALMSNVLRKNSAADHRDIATRIDELVARLNP